MDWVALGPRSLKRNLPTVTLVALFILIGVIIFQSTSPISLKDSIYGIDRAGNSKKPDDSKAYTTPVTEPIPPHPGRDALGRDPTTTILEGFNGLGSCSQPQGHKDKAVILMSSFNDELTASRVRFGGGSNRYNPNLIPLPDGSEHQYIGFVRYGREEVHEVHWCLMKWIRVPITERKFLQCATAVKKLAMPHFRTKPGACKKVPFLDFDQGLLDPRIYFSPFGEPLMVVGSNSHISCLGMYVIDLRALIPELSTLLHIENVPVRYIEYSELSGPPPIEEISKNWFSIYDLENKEYWHHSIAPSQIITRAGQSAYNIASSQPNCLTGISKKGDVKLHQASNSLRLTLCKFPCKPTVENTVIIAMIHAKAVNEVDIYYRRYIVVMNATAPFEILGYSKNLNYAGTDEYHMIYTISMAWDTQLRHRKSWKIFDTPGTPSETILRKRAELGVPDQQLPPRQENAKPGADFVLPPEAKWMPADEVSHHNTMSTQYNNPIVSDYYHGWIDDDILISFGIRDSDAGVIHVKARDLVDCIHLCD
ncbi:hypothetical protein V1511DRAFT_487437 [Dipodascopsis uninucleata]